MITVDASPTKRFFVSMLTRDIDLGDAILDLIDNCVDGILRSLQETPDRQLDEKTPYSGYWVKIEASPDEFSIRDNCGGIPRDIAINSAFRLGRLDENRDNDIPTVGMYGIGMKRAIFKLGRKATVLSQNKSDAYSVEITPEWLDNDSSWKLELAMESYDHSFPDGTSIKVTKLHSSVAKQFNSSESNFLIELEDTVSQLFALIIEKGFQIFLNNQPIKPVSLDILYSDSFASNSIAPYAYQTTYMDVKVDLVVGFYREPAKVEEIEDEQKIARSRDNAGWTIICNDRVVLHRDTSKITGWGDADVPKYHTQFIAIAGVVYFNSNISEHLPLNTTKRGLDTNSLVYWHVIKYMREGLKKFTQFTNRWKGREQETDSQFRATRLNDPLVIINEIPVDKWDSIREEPTARRFAPSLPAPTELKDTRRIVFTRPIAEIALLGEYFFDNAEADPKNIGNRCFDEALKLAKE